MEGTVSKINKVFTPFRSTKYIYEKFNFKQNFLKSLQLEEVC